MGDHLTKHGDGVKDIAFAVEDLDTIFAVRFCSVNSLDGTNHKPKYFTKSNM